MTNFYDLKMLIIRILEKILKNFFCTYFLVSLTSGMNDCAYQCFLNCVSRDAFKDTCFTIETEFYDHYDRILLPLMT